MNVLVTLSHASAVVATRAVQEVTKCGFVSLCVHLPGWHCCHIGPD